LSGNCATPGWVAFTGRTRASNPFSLSSECVNGPVRRVIARTLGTSSLSGKCAHHLGLEQVPAGCPHACRRPARRLARTPAAGLPQSCCRAAHRPARKSAAGLPRASCKSGLRHRPAAGQGPSLAGTRVARGTRRGARENQRGQLGQGGTQGLRRSGRPKEWKAIGPEGKGGGPGNLREPRRHNPLGPPKSSGGIHITTFACGRHIVAFMIFL
jgi:hypothetical protein